MAGHKQMTLLRGVLTAMTTPLEITKENGSKMTRSVLTIETVDGQKGFFEARAQTIERIDKLSIEVGNNVLVGYVFIGSEKNDKLYNNLFINSISHDER
jgi:hypothetical protein